MLNRKLVNLRERICDDWVIQLTGARKNYAQCLLDLVRDENRAIPLALALNQPSQLESRIDSILKHNRRLDLQPRRRLLVVAVTLLLTCLPLLATAQLIPLRTFQVSLFAQTPQESEETVETTEKKRGEQKKMKEMKEKKEYKEGKSIKVLDPSKFYKDQENKVYSGPQPGEKLPPLMVTNLYGENKDKAFDITAKTDGKPLILFLQDNNVASIKGMNHNIEMLSKVDNFQRKQTNASGTEIYNQGLQIGIVFLLDDANKLPDWSDEFLKGLETNNIKVCVSPDGREGPGSYGLNRNVAQTIIIAKDGKVLHNFVFTQPAFYADPHVLGAVAQAIEIQPDVLEKWLNQEMTKKSEEDVKRYKRKVTEANTKLVALKFSILHLKVKSGKISKEEAAEQLKKLGITWEEGEELFKKEQDSDKTMDKYDIGPLLDKLREDLEKLEKVTKELDAVMDGKLLKNKTDTSQKMDKYDIGPLLDKLMEDLESLKEDLDTIMNGRLLKKEADTSQKMDRARQRQVRIADPKNFSTSEEKQIFSGPQPGEKLPPLKATAINGEAKGETFDFIAKADGQPHVLFLQDGTPLGLRGLVGFTRLLDKITDKSKQKIHVQVVFLDDSPGPLAKQVSRIVPHVPSNVRLGISPDGREGPGTYGLNRNVAQTVIIAKDGKVLHNFALTQPMLSPDPYVLGAVGELIGEKPATLEKWLNAKNPIIQIKNPSEGEEVGKMLLNGTFVLNGNVVHLNGTVVKFDELRTLLRNLPEEQKSTLIIQAERDVPHEQITKVMDIAKEAGIEKIGFAIDSAEDKSSMRNKEDMRSSDSEKVDALKKRLAEMVEKGEITIEEALERYQKAFPHSEDD